MINPLPKKRIIIIFKNQKTLVTKMSDVTAELDTAIPKHELLDNTAAKHKTDLIHRCSRASSS